MHYAIYITSIRPFFRELPYFNLHSLHEVEFVAIIALAAYRYRGRGGIILVALTIFASIPFILTAPYIFGRDPRPNEL